MNVHRAVIDKCVDDMTMAPIDALIEIVQELSDKVDVMNQNYHAMRSTLNGDEA